MMIARGRTRLIRWVAILGVVSELILTATPSTPAAGIRPLWAELKWRFPIDQWGIGKTFHCTARDCGRDVELHLRAKIGFCNCTTGLADDEELERVADFDLFGDRPLALAPGRAVKVRQMAGRSRVYSISAAGAGQRTILTIALNRKCDAVVATLMADRGNSGDLEAAALEFLGGDIVARWVGSTLGS
jgi:hypothetical protein